MTRAVLHLVNLKETPTAPPFSGAENHLWVLLPALAAAGARVELGVLLESGGPRIDAKLAELEAAGIRTHRLPFRRPCDPRCLAALRRLVGARPDAVVHTHLLPADCYGSVAARLAGNRRVVTTCHNDEPTYLSGGRRRLLRMVDRLAAHHVAISERVRRYLLDGLGVAEGKVTVIRYGVPPPGPVNTRAAARAALGLPADAFVVGFVGRLVPQKNVGLLLTAAGRRPDIVCAIVGDGPLRGDLERQARGLPNVRFAGHRSGAEDLMPAFDVLCLPSRWEGLGLVLVEAMLRGVPVAGSRAGAIPEVLGDGRFGELFEPDDADSLLAAVARARDGGPELAERAARHAARTFAVGGMVEGTLAVYDRVSGRPEMT
jgi:glycosyltransferase involved in cell wall biosynthesis